MNQRRSIVALRPLLAAALLLLSQLVGAASGDTEIPEEPDEVVRVVSEDIQQLIERHRDSFDDSPQAYYDAVDERMAPFIDYESIAKAVMARYWSDASPDQRERFTRSFRDGLVRSYARALLEFEQQRVEVLPILPEHRREDRALVRMEITGGNGRIYPVNYSMGRGEDGVWQVRNVIVDGVNLGLTYRNQFASAMQSGGSLDSVIGDWFVPTTPGA